MIKLIGSNHEVDDFLLSLNKQKFLEVTRSGLLGMGTGENFLISESETTIEVLRRKTMEVFYEKDSNPELLKR